MIQGALAWLWANGSNNIPIPGFRTLDQISSNIQALDKGALNNSQMQEIQSLLYPEYQPV
ncbi:hypothetical protein JCM19233_6057 [Vibrio astriarenae]|nr:hypothetical protein JCM19233_6057 [Vibrio sp. C7]